ncbi:MAG: DUF1501 domain-containing protein [Planctomycetota bacterium]|nr:DUF1501 domain-containing protein [Planctomycetota bacterium]
MKCNYACNSNEHLIARRGFLGNVLGAAGVVGGLGAFTNPAVSAQLESQQKRVVVFNMAGGLSQLESWDPKPGTDTGGPFRAIPTSVPGIHISELLPKTAKQMQHLALVRSINTKENDHGKGRYAMFTGRRQTPAQEFPQIGAVMAKALDGDKNALPGHIQVSSSTGGRSNDSAYLGPAFASITIASGKPPANSARPEGVSEQQDVLRNDFRRSVNDRFSLRRRSAQTDAYANSYEQAQQLMARREVFDITKEPSQDHDRYGKHELGQHSLLARRLLENGVTFVQVTHSNYDTHNENFNFHLEQVGEFDQAYSALVADLADRGMLDSTLIVVLSEFGRTPRINQYYGRDHWGTAWSICLGGANVQRGAVIGSTNDNGTAVKDREVDHGHLFHTYLQAVGVDSQSHFSVGGQDIPVADPAYAPIEELLI